MRHGARRRNAVTGAVTAVILAAAGAVAVASSPAPTDAVSITPGEPTVTVDGELDGLEVDKAVAAVRAAAAEVDGAVPDRDVHVHLVDGRLEIEGHDGGLLHGYQSGTDVWVRTASLDLARVERILLHEVAHVLAPGDEHGDVWRAVFVGAVEQLHGGAAGDDERARIEWRYDRCYLDDSCVHR